MERMDERAKAELYKINHEKFLLSVLIIAVFLTVKIYINAGILGMLGELTAAGVILLYLIPYFIIRRKYETLDEMAKTKLYKLSTAFFIIEMASMLPIIIIVTTIQIQQIGEPMSNIMGSSLLFIMALTIIINIYGLVRMHNEKFVTRKAADLSLKDYKKRLLIRAVTATAVMVGAIIILAVLNHYIINEMYPESHLNILFSTGILFCLLSIPCTWFLYFYYLGTRKKLEKKIEPEEIT